MFIENTPTLETQRLILRKFTDKDIDDMFLLYSDEDVNRFLPWYPMKTKSEVEEYLHNIIYPFYKKEVAYSYAISQKIDDKVIGYVHINDIGESNDMGYALRKEYWRKGIVSEACSAILNRLKQAQFPFITATHDINNPYSGDVMKKIGMTYRYSYQEQWQPKDISVTFRMYQIDLCGACDTYTGYKKKYPHFIEKLD
ncbi:MAG: GNAT family N-acetyltransferase [Clostridia bacterium]|nr:GNAT family N-acetyltransferase [Clostridia bacterium]